MISQTAEYALRAMVYLALTKGASTGQEIADKTKVPAGYLKKIMHQLGRARLVDSQRGVGGGFVLAREARAISILDVVNAVDPIERLLTCPLDLDNHGLNLCPLHKRLSAATAAVEAAFAESNLSELVEESQSPLCQSKPLSSGKSN